MSLRFFAKLISESFSQSFAILLSLFHRSCDHLNYHMEKLYKIYILISLYFFGKLISKHSHDFLHLIYVSPKLRLFQ